MPTEVPSERQQQIQTQPEMHRAVRDMRTAMREDALPLRKLARTAGSSAAALCMWERGLGGLRPAQQRAVLRIVRAEFTRFCAHVAQVAERHGIAAG